MLSSSSAFARQGSVSRVATPSSRAPRSSAPARSCLTWALAAALVAAGMIPRNADAGGPGPQIGQVSMLIGQAHLIRSDGTRVSLAHGSQIRAGDRIETAANGHVHVRFVDNGHASVRPDSALEVQAYRFDAQQPEAAEVRLRVERGTARSISGDATALDKSRFRLNTPIAAIGVRGTDFIVQTDALGIRATVADGSIVVTPYGASCEAAGLGPCGGLDARELSASMGRVVAELRPGDPIARFVPSADLAFSQLVAFQERGEQGWRGVALAAARGSGLLSSEPSAAQQQRGNDSSGAEVLTLATVALPNVQRLPRLDAPLVWGRWGFSPLPLDRISVPFSIARIGRHVTVADFEVGLFRNDVPGFTTLLGAGASGIVEFRLDRVSATFETANAVESVLVSGSNLTLDFNRRTFATALDLSSASGVRGELRAAGEVRPDGIFAVRDDFQRVAGAVSLDGKEAGYLFETGALGRLFRGRTLWVGGP